MNTIELASLFSTGAVLQRDEAIPVWGRTRPHARIRARLGPHSGIVQAAKTGDFFVWLPALPAGGPHVLDVHVDGEQEGVCVEDIWIGEVWIASGQSNMEWKLPVCGEEGLAAISAPPDSPLRLFHVEQCAALGPEREVSGRWEQATQENKPGFSAVAYHFARALRASLKVPVGVIVSAWGGSWIHAWMSRSALLSLENTAAWTLSTELTCYEEARWRWMPEDDTAPVHVDLPADPGNAGVKEGWADPAYDDRDWLRMNLPNTWQAAGHDLSGVCWFRRRVRLPAAWVGKPLTLAIGTADKQDMTYVNGREAGRTGQGFEEQYWNRLREYPVPPEWVTSEDLCIAVRVYSFLYDGGLCGPAAHMRLTCEGDPEAMRLAGEWAYRFEHDFGKIPAESMAGHRSKDTPHILFDNMLEPMAPYAARGVLWYQGESNTSEAPAYRDLLKTLIADWRGAWGKPKWPFLVVQLPLMNVACSYDPTSNWAPLRESQRRAVAETPGAGLAVTLDLGEAEDIHPKRKAEVGERLAQVAMTDVYGAALADGAAGGPLPVSAASRDGRVCVRFARVAGGLSTRDGKEPCAFLLAGSDGLFHPANAQIDHDQVQVWCAAIRAPVAVRYAWADNPADANLVDRSGLPASPFEMSVSS